MQEGGIKKWESYNGKGNITLGNRKGMDVRNEGGGGMEGGEAGRAVMNGGS